MVKRNVSSIVRKKGSKAKVTGQGQRGQITLKNDWFLAVTSIAQKVIDRF